MTRTRSSATGKTSCTPRSARAWFAGALIAPSIAALLVGCNARLGSSGLTGDGSTGPGAGSGAEEPLPAFEPHAGLLRRLTRAQFRNSIERLLGVQVDTTTLDPDSFNGDFAAVGASTVTTSSLGVERYHAAIEGAVAEVFADDSRRAALLGCTPALDDTSCVRGYLERLGRSAWRRPLSTEELDRLVGVATVANTQLEDAIEGARWSTIALLESLHFLYRPELGEPRGDGALVHRDYELASRLSFLIWNSPPDDELLDAAGSGALDTKEGILAQVDRMLAVPEGRESASAFAEDYMRLDRIASQPKDTGLFPEYGAALQAAMVRDMREVWATVAFDRDASMLEVFSTTDVYANAELAAFYGLDPSGLDSETYKSFTLPGDGTRLGILGKPGFLSQFANQREGSPTLRGKFIREAILCEHVPLPPEGVALEIPESVEGTATTKRQRLEQHRSNRTCAGCHAMMDPLGLPLESFDAIGRYRTTEQGLPIDPSGDFDGVPVADSRELGSVMSQSDTVAECIVRKYYTYSMGHAERDVDEVVIQALAASFSVSGNRLRALIREIATSEAFSLVAPQL